MKKPLHELEPDRIVVRALMKGVTCVDDLIESANDGDELAERWLSRLSRYGVSNTFLTAIEEHARTVRYDTFPKADRTAKKFRWAREMYPNQTVSREAAYAIILVLLINSEKADYVRKCAAEDCQRLFFGAQNKRWCSDTCGSRVRVTEKRKRDSQ